MPLFSQAGLTAVVLSVLLVSACLEQPTQPAIDGSYPELKPGKGGGNGGGGSTALDVSFVAGDITGDGMGVYDGDLSPSGTFSLSVAPRLVTISDILDGSGSLVHAAPGPVEATFNTTSCCDFRAMTAVIDEDVVQANPNDFKLALQWWEGNTRFTLSFGVRWCIPGNDPVPSSDPRRGTRVQVTQVVAAADTTWSLQDAGPGALCQFIDRPGRKNDEFMFISDNAAVDLNMDLSTQ